jgi:hypothetical protein
VRLSDRASTSNIANYLIVNLRVRVFFASSRIQSFWMKPRSVLIASCHALTVNSRTAPVPSRGSSFSVTVARVLGACSNPEVIGIHALWGVAPMTDDETVWNLSVGTLV